ncbi:sigma-70 family RNA polymerase sigma factor [Streptomyces sp. NPDC093248]|uniref:RNA polymerase sigma factor n=1 Tax=Streptomyces sp. NPDC093248 TaxID=3155072 RepID=UPI003420340C
MTFDELYQQGFTRVVRSLVLVGADQATAEDLAQDAFCVTYGRWDEVCHYQSPIAWTAKTALNKWHQHSRTQGRRQGLLAKVSALRSLGREHRDLILVEKRLDVQRWLKQLPFRQREVIVLHYICDQSVSDIAVTLEISVGTVKSQLHDARQALTGLAADGDAENRTEGGPE